MLEEAHRIESAQEAYRPRLEKRYNESARPRRKKKSLCPKIRTQSEVIHDTPDALEAKETVEAVIEVVRELPKTLEDA